MPQKYPLQWPVGYPRTQSPSRSAFKNPTLGKVVSNVLQEINRINGEKATSSLADNAVISSNVPLRNDGLPRADYMRSQISDKGVAVYFKKGETDVVLCCDKWDTVESNLHAIYLTIEALRSVDRWGVSDFLSRSFTGFKALTAGPGARPWYEVFGYQDPPAQTEDKYIAVETYYKRLVKIHHPDAGGSTEKFQELASAWRAAQNYFLRKPGAAPAY